MKNKFTHIMIGLATAIVIALIIFARKRHEEKFLKSLKITIDASTGNFFVDDKSVERLIFSADGPVKRKKIQDIHTSEIEKKIDNHPFIQKSEVFLTADGTLHATIRQQEPVLRIKDGLKNYYLTKEGEPMPLSPTYAAKVILGEGSFSKEDQKALLALISYIDTDKLLKNQIIGIRKIAPNSFNLIPRVGQHTIAFGALTDFDAKLEKLKAFYEQYSDKIVTDQYKVISLQYKNQVVATKR